MKKLQPRRAPRLVLLASLCAGLIGPASSQTVLINENFESPTGAGIPTGWTIATGAYDDTTANLNPSGINTSANVLVADAVTARVASPVIDLTGFSGATFTLEFDLYNPFVTTLHGLIVGYGQSGAVQAWAAAATTASAALGGGQTIINLSAPATWQHYSLDVTSWVNTYSGDQSLFTISFQDWNQTTSDVTLVDNVVFTATAVPEPSTYAAIFGALALAGVIVRRHRLGSVARR